MYKLICSNLTKTHRSLTNFTGYYRTVAQKYNKGLLCKKKYVSETDLQNTQGLDENLDCAEELLEVEPTSNSPTQSYTSFFGQKVKGSPLSYTTINKGQQISGAASIPSRFFHTTSAKDKQSKESSNKQFKDDEAEKYYQSAVEQCFRIKNKMEKYYKEANWIAVPPKLIRDLKKEARLLNPTKKKQEKGNPNYKNLKQIEAERQFRIPELEKISYMKSHKPTYQFKQPKVRITYPTHTARYKMGSNGYKLQYKIKQQVMKDNKIKTVYKDAVSEPLQTMKVKHQITSEEEKAKVKQIKYKLCQKRIPIVANLLQKNYIEENSEQEKQQQKFEKMVIKQHPAVQHDSNVANRMAFKSRYNKLLQKSGLLYQGPSKSKTKKRRVREEADVAEQQVTDATQAKESTPSTSQKPEDKTSTDTKQALSTEFETHSHEGDGELKVMEHPIANVKEVLLDLPLKNSKRILCEKSEQFDIDAVCIKTNTNANTTTTYGDYLIESEEKVKSFVEACKNEQKDDLLKLKDEATEAEAEKMTVPVQESQSVAKTMTSTDRFEEYLNKLRELRDQTSVDRIPFKRQEPWKISNVMQKYEPQPDKAPRIKSIEQEAEERGQSESYTHISLDSMKSKQYPLASGFVVRKEVNMRKPNEDNIYRRNIPKEKQLKGRYSVNMPKERIPVLRNPSLKSIRSEKLAKVITPPPEACVKKPQQKPVFVPITARSMENKQSNLWKKILEQYQTKAPEAKVQVSVAELKRINRKKRRERARKLMQQAKMQQKKLEDKQRNDILKERESANEKTTTKESLSMPNTTDKQESKEDTREKLLLKEKPTIKPVVEKELPVQSYKVDTAKSLSVVDDEKLLKINTSNSQDSVEDIFKAAFKEREEQIMKNFQNAGNKVIDEKVKQQVKETLVKQLLKGLSPKENLEKLLHEVIGKCKSTNENNKLNLKSVTEEIANKAMIGKEKIDDSMNAKEVQNKVEPPQAIVDSKRLVGPESKPHKSKPISGKLEKTLKKEVQKPDNKLISDEKEKQIMTEEKKLKENLQETPKVAAALQHKQSAENKLLPRNAISEKSSESLEMQMLKRDVEEAVNKLKRTLEKYSADAVKKKPKLMPAANSCKLGQKKMFGITKQEKKAGDASEMGETYLPPHRKSKEKWTNFRVSKDKFEEGKTADNLEKKKEPGQKTASKKLLEEENHMIKKLNKIQQQNLLKLKEASTNLVKLVNKIDISKNVKIDGTVKSAASKLCESSKKLVKTKKSDSSQKAIISKKSDSGDKFAVPENQPTIQKDKPPVSKEKSKKKQPKSKTDIVLPPKDPGDPKIQYTHCKDILAEITTDLSKTPVKSKMATDLTRKCRSLIELAAEQKNKILREIETTWEKENSKKINENINNELITKEEKMELEKDLGVPIINKRKYSKEHYPNTEEKKNIRKAKADNVATCLDITKNEKPRLIINLKYMGPIRKTKLKTETATRKNKKDKTFTNSKDATPATSSQITTPFTTNNEILTQNSTLNLIKEQPFNAVSNITPSKLPPQKYSLDLFFSKMKKGKIENDCLKKKSRVPSIKNLTLRGERSLDITFPKRKKGKIEDDWMRPHKMYLKERFSDYGMRNYASKSETSLSLVKNGRWSSKMDAAFYFTSMRRGKIENDALKEVALNKLTISKLEMIDNIDQHKNELEMSCESLRDVEEIQNLEKQPKDLKIKEKETSVVEDASSPIKKQKQVEMPGKKPIVTKRFKSSVKKKHIRSSSNTILEKKHSRNSIKKAKMPVTNDPEKKINKIKLEKLPGKKTKDNTDISKRSIKTDSTMKRSEYKPSKITTNADKQLEDVLKNYQVYNRPVKRGTLTNASSTPSAGDALKTKNNGKKLSRGVLDLEKGAKDSKTFVVKDKNREVKSMPGTISKSTTLNKSTKPICKLSQLSIKTSKRTHNDLLTEKPSKKADSDQTKDQKSSNSKFSDPKTSSNLLQLGKVEKQTSGIKEKSCTTAISTHSAAKALMKKPKNCKNLLTAKIQKSVEKHDDKKDTCNKMTTGSSKEPKIESGADDKPDNKVDQNQANSDGKLFLQSVMNDGKDSLGNKIVVTCGISDDPTGTENVEEIKEREATIEIPGKRKPMLRVSTTPEMQVSMSSDISRDNYTPKTNQKLQLREPFLDLPVVMPQGNLNKGTKKNEHFGNVLKRRATSKKPERHLTTITKMVDVSKRHPGLAQNKRGAQFQILRSSLIDMFIKSEEQETGWGDQKMLQTIFINKNITNNNFPEQTFKLVNRDVRPKVRGIKYSKVGSGIDTLRMKPRKGKDVSFSKKTSIVLFEEPKMIIPKPRIPMGNDTTLQLSEYPEDVKVTKADVIRLTQNTKKNIFYIKHMLEKQLDVLKAITTAINSRSVSSKKTKDRIKDSTVPMEIDASREIRYGNNKMPKKDKKIVTLEKKLSKEINKMLVQEKLAQSLQKVKTVENFKNDLFQKEDCTCKLSKEKLKNDDSTPPKSIIGMSNSQTEKINNKLNKGLMLTTTEGKTYKLKKNNLVHAYKKVKHILSIVKDEGNIPCEKTNVNNTGDDKRKSQHNMKQVMSKYKNKPPKLHRNLIMKPKAAKHNSQGSKLGNKTGKRQLEKSKKTSKSKANMQVMTIASPKHDNLNLDETSIENSKKDENLKIGKENAIESLYDDSIENSNSKTIGDKSNSAGKFTNSKESIDVGSNDGERLQPIKEVDGNQNLNNLNSMSEIPQSSAIKKMDNITCNHGELPTSICNFYENFLPIKNVHSERIQEVDNDDSERGHAFWNQNSKMAIQKFDDSKFNCSSHSLSKNIKCLKSTVSLENLDTLNCKHDQHLFMEKTQSEAGVKDKGNNYDVLNTCEDEVMKPNSKTIEHKLFDINWGDSDKGISYSLTKIEESPKSTSSTRKLHIVSRSISIDQIGEEKMKGKENDSTKSQSLNETIKCDNLAKWSDKKENERTRISYSLSKVSEWPKSTIRMKKLNISRWKGGSKGLIKDVKNKKAKPDNLNNETSTKTTSSVNIRKVENELDSMMKTLESKRILEDVKEKTFIVSTLNAKLDKLKKDLDSPTVLNSLSKKIVPNADNNIKESVVPKECIRNSVSTRQFSNHSVKSYIDLGSCENQGPTKMNLSQDSKFKSITEPILRNGKSKKQESKVRQFLPTRKEVTYSEMKAKSKKRSRDTQDEETKCKFLMQVMKKQKIHDEPTELRPAKMRKYAELEAKKQTLHASSRVAKSVQITEKDIGFVGKAAVSEKSLKDEEKENKVAEQAECKEGVKEDRKQFSFVTDVKPDYVVMRNSCSELQKRPQQTTDKEKLRDSFICYLNQKKCFTKKYLNDDSNHLQSKTLDGYVQKLLATSESNISEIQSPLTLSQSNKLEATRINTKENLVCNIQNEETQCKENKFLLKKSDSVTKASIEKLLKKLSLHKIAYEDFNNGERADHVAKIEEILKKHYKEHEKIYQFNRHLIRHLKRHRKKVPQKSRLKTRRNLLDPSNSEANDTKTMLCKFLTNRYDERSTKSSLLTTCCKSKMAVNYSNDKGEKLPPEEAKEDVIRKSLTFHIEKEVPNRYLQKEIPLPLKPVPRFCEKLCLPLKSIFQIAIKQPIEEMTTLNKFQEEKVQVAPKIEHINQHDKYKPITYLTIKPSRTIDESFLPMILNVANKKKSNAIKKVNTSEMIRKEILEFRYELLQKLYKEFNELCKNNMNENSGNFEKVSNYYKSVTEGIKDKEEAKIEVNVEPKSINELLGPSPKPTFDRVCRYYNHVMRKDVKDKDGMSNTMSSADGGVVNHRQTLQQKLSKKTSEDDGKRNNVIDTEGLTEKKGTDNTDGNDPQNSQK